jgi:hypothetical protein
VSFNNRFLTLQDAIISILNVKSASLERMPGELVSCRKTLGGRYQGSIIGQPARLGVQGGGLNGRLAEN